jgi:thymidylate synthase
MSSFNNVWAGTVQAILTGGQEVSPRGKLTKEIPQHTVAVPMRQPVLTIKDRMLNYRFMAAEAYWILSGDDSVAGIVPWNSRIAAFSDNGETFFGAYGPKIISQLDYVVNKLKTDPDSRQAGLTIWRENPTETKDVPCTVAIFANLRGRFLNIHVFMRSSDVWLGLPYDVFNFSMLGHLICSRLNIDDQLDRLIEPGTLYLTAASSHLYEPNWEDARKCVSVNSLSTNGASPSALYLKEDTLMGMLKELRDTKPGDLLRWWE